MRQKKYNNSSIANIYQHYNETELPFVKEIVALKEAVLQSNSVKTTKFLTLSEQAILMKIIGNELEVLFISGTDTDERKIACISNFPLDGTTQNMITIFKITYNNKFYQLKHSDVLGSILALGIERNVIGDIIVTSDEIYLMVLTKIESFILLNYQQIGKTPIQIQKIDFIPLDTQHVNTENIETVTVSALRIDNLLSKLLHKSRTIVKKMIDQDLIQQNWQIVQTGKTVYVVDDVLSVRRFGRITIKEINITKNEKYRVIVQINKK